MTQKAVLPQSSAPIVNSKGQMTPGHQDFLRRIIANIQQQLTDLQAQLLSITEIAYAIGSTDGTTATIQDIIFLIAEQQIGIQFKDEGSDEGALGEIDTVNFVGAGISAVAAGTALTVTVSGGGAGSQVGFAYTTSTTSASTASVIPQDDTIPQNTEGAAYASLDTSITPKFTTSLLEVEVYIPWMSANGLRTPTLALFRDSGADAIAARFSTSVAASGAAAEGRIRAIVSAGSTSATTFKLRWGIDAGTGYLLQSAGTEYFSTSDKAIMTVREIAQ